MDLIFEDRFDTLAEEAGDHARELEEASSRPYIIKTLSASLGWKVMVRKRSTMRTENLGSARLTEMFDCMIKMVSKSQE